MTIADPLFKRAGVDNETDEAARRAVKSFRRLQPTLSAYARVLTKNPKARVEMAARDNGSTDGERIFFRPPLALGDKTAHSRQLCDKRDDHKQLLCRACAIREDVLVTIYHEIAHISFDSFAKTSDRDQRNLIEEAVKQVKGEYAERVRERIKMAPSYTKSSYIGMASLINKFLPIIVNALEDARVNRELFKARRGTKVMFDADTWKIFTEGVEQKDASGNIIVKQWTEYPLNMQAIVGVFVKASGYDYSDWFVPQVIAALNDEELTQLCNQLDTVRSAAGVYQLSFPVLQRLRELGFCRTDQDPDPEEEQGDEGDSDEADPSPEDQDSSADGEPDDGDSGASSDSSGGSESGMDDSDSDDSESDDGTSPGKEPGQAGSSDEEADGAVDNDSSDDDSSGDEDSGDQGSPESGEASDSGDSPGAETSGDSDSEESGGAGGDDEASEPSSDSDGDTSSDEDSAGSSEDSSGEAGESGADDSDSAEEGGEPETDSDSEEAGAEATGPRETSSPEEGPIDENSEGSSEAEPEDSGSSDSEGSGDEAGSPGAGDSAGDMGSADDSVDQDGDDHGQGSGDGSGDEADLHNPDVAGPEGVDPLASPPTGGEAPDQSVESGEQSETAGREAEHSGEADGSESTGSDSETDTDDGEAIDSGADDGQGGTQVVEDEKFDDLPMGEPEEVQAALEVWGDHDEKPKTIEEKHVEEAVDRAIIQGLYFETPSRNVYGVREHKFGDPIYADGHSVSTAWDHRVYESMGISKKQLGITGDFDPAESTLGPALLRMRVAFADNARGKEERHKKGGKIDARVLGKRAPQGDPRLMKKKTLPGRKNYFVLIGMDVSGSTIGRNIALEKLAVMAQATLLHRMGIDFAIYAHTGDYHSPEKGRGNGVDLDIYFVKTPEEIWDTERKDRLMALGPASANLDGHSLEYYRKVLDRVQATDKIILYYTDGKMPAENHNEELEILQREIRICKQRNYTLLGVGIRTDSPVRHGLDTVQVDEEKDVVKVIKHLEKRLLAN